MSIQSESWGIVGSGVMGMTLAMRLAQKGYKVTVFESTPSVGGLAGAVDMGGVRWDQFYHVILLSDHHTRNVLEEIGLQEDQLNWVETKTGFFSGGKLYSMSNIVEFLRFPPINLLDKFRLGITIVAASRIKDWRRMEKIPVEKWLRRWSGNRVFERIWLPLLKAKLGDRYRDTSASFIWATIQRMYAARRTGLKKEMFGYVTGGYHTVITAFEKKIKDLGVNIILNTGVAEITRNEDDAIQIKTVNKETYTFNKVISTLPSEISCKIAPSIKSEELEKHRDIQYLGVVCPSILLKKPVSEYYVTNIIDDWPPFTGVIEMTALIDPVETGNMHLVYLPSYVDPSDSLFEMKEEDLKNYFLGSFFKMYPDFSYEDVIHWNLASARRVFALPTLNYSATLPPVTTSINGYYIINTAQIINGTLNVNETVQIAESKLEEILTN